MVCYGLILKVLKFFTISFLKKKKKAPQLWSSDLNANVNFLSEMMSEAVNNGKIKNEMKYKKIFLFR